MNNYIFCFIDGYTLKYTEFTTAAANLESAKTNFYGIYGSNFDHQIINIYANGKKHIQPQ